MTEDFKSSTVNIIWPENIDGISDTPNYGTVEEKGLPKKDNCLSRCLESVHNNLEKFAEKYKTHIKWLISILINVGFIGYFSYATKYFLDQNYDSVPFCDGDQYGILILLVCFVYLLLFNAFIYQPHFSPKVKESSKPVRQKLYQIFSITWVKVCVYLILIAASIGFLVWDSQNDPNRLMALIGFIAMLLVGFIFSKHPGRIKWKPVILGIILQFVLGLFTIRWVQGRNMFACAGDKVTTFLKYSDVGSSFAFGDDLIKNNVFAFEGLSVIFFLSFFIRILYYYGVIQKVVISLGWVLQKIMGTTICESVNSAANIFLGMTESPILLQPYLQNLTLSETHAVMTSGFASVSGTVLAAYISFGAKASHLITASVMSAPAALCFSKLFYPETEVSQSTQDTIVMPENDDSSVLDAASKGASQAVEIVLGIIANIIAFITFVAFLNGVVGWFGVLVGQDNWSIEAAMAYVFMPVSYIMGVPWSESFYVGRLIGIKTVINEFAAYKELGQMLKQNLLSKRSEAIATYAVCGFSNPGSVGIMISTMSTLMPGKRSEITSLAFRTFVSGAIVCFMTACIAGMLMSEDQL